MISVHFQDKTFNITIIQNCAPTSNAKEAEVEQFSEDPQDLLQLTPINDVLFIIGDWNEKVRSQEIHGITGKFGLGVQNKAGPRLTGFDKRMHWSQQTPSSSKRQLYTWTSPRWSTPKSDRSYSLWPKMEKLYTVNKNKTGS